MSIKWAGTATAISSIVHSAETLGTINYLRRERVLMPDGTFEDIPVISGNALRGMLRDTAADLWWNEVGRPKLTLPVAHALWSGGALAKASGPVLSGSRLQDLRRCCPVIGVFGTAGGGRIIAGALQVGKLIPICAETAHLLGKPDTKSLPSVWDLTQIEYYSRIPDERGTDTTALDDSESGLARFGVETFLAGTRFNSWISLAGASAAEEAFFAEVLGLFTDDARVGGMARAGHGQLSMDLLPGREPQTEDWRASTAVDPKKLREMLAWLD